MPKTSGNGCRCVRFDTENSRNVHHIAGTCKEQGNHTRCRNDGVPLRLVVPPLHASKTVRWGVTTPDWPAQFHVTALCINSVSDIHNYN